MVMKFLVLLSMSFSFSALGNLSAGLKHTISLQKDFVIFNKIINSNSLFYPLEDTKRIDMLLKDFRAKLAAAEPEDITAINNEQLVNKRLDWLEEEDKVLDKLYEDTDRLKYRLTHGLISSSAAMNKKREHASRLLDEIQALRADLVAHFIPATRLFTSLPLIQQETVLNESAEIADYKAVRAEFVTANGSNSDMLAQQLVKNLLIIMAKNYSTDSKMKFLRDIIDLLTVDLLKIMPHTTSLSDDEFRSHSSLRELKKLKYANRVFQGVAEIVAAGFPEVVEKLKQLSPREIERLFNFTDLYFLNTEDTVPLSEHVNSDPLARHVYRDLTTGTANLIKLFGLFSFTTNKEMLRKITRKIDNIQAARQ